MRVHERLEFLGAPVLGIVLVGPQIPSVSREYSGYSRPPGGWRKRRKIMRKRGIQIGARAETLAPTRDATPSDARRAIPSATAAARTTITVEPAVTRAVTVESPPVVYDVPVSDVPDSGTTADETRPSRRADDLSPRPRWRRRESRRDE
jgi:hypothetical protein